MFDRSFDEVKSIYQKATACTYCFDQEIVRKGEIQMAQPRPIGLDYWKSEKKVVVVLLNPGKRKDDDYASELDHYKKGDISLEYLFDFQHCNMAKWGKYPGHFSNFYFCQLGLSHDTVAFVNIALCETEGNKYPREVIQECMNRFTLPLIASLRPTIILLSGSRVQALEREIHERIPCSDMINIPHYAHRKGETYERAKLSEAQKHLVNLETR